MVLYVHLWILRGGSFYETHVVGCRREDSQILAKPAQPRFWVQGRLRICSDAGNNVFLYHDSRFCTDADEIIEIPIEIQVKNIAFRPLRIYKTVFSVVMWNSKVQFFNFRNKKWLVSDEWRVVPSENTNLAFPSRARVIPSVNATQNAILLNIRKQ